MSGGSKMSLGSKMSKNSKKSEAKEKLLTASARAGLPVVMLEQPFLIPAQSIETVYIDATSADTMYGATDEYGIWCDGIAMRRLRPMIQGTADIYTAAGNRGIYTSNNSSGGGGSSTNSATAIAAKKSDGATTEDKKVKTSTSSSTTVSTSSTASSSKLLVLDGNVSAILESMLSSDVFTVPSIASPVSAASDNRRLSMPDGTWLSLTSMSHVAIETLSVAHLSPSTLTAVAIVFIEPSRDEMIEGVVSAWLQKLNASSNWSDTVKQTLTEALSHRQLYAAQQHEDHNSGDSINTTHHYSDPLHAMSVVPYSACFTVSSTTGTRTAMQYNDNLSPSIALNRIRSMLLILEGMLDWFKEQQQQQMADVSSTTVSDTSSKHVALQTYMLYVYAVTWGIGGHISTTSGRHSFSDFVKAQMPQHVKAHLSKDSSISLYDTVVDLKRAMLVSTETVMINMQDGISLIGIPRGIWTSKSAANIKQTSYGSSSASLTSAPPLCYTMLEATSRVIGVGTALLHFSTYMGLNCVLQGATGSGKTCLLSHLLQVAGRDCPNPNNIANINITPSQTCSSLISSSSTSDTSLAVLKQLRDTMVSRGTRLIQETAASSVRRHSVNGDTALMCKNALTKLQSNTDANIDTSNGSSVSASTQFNSKGTTAATATVATASAVSQWTTNSSVYISASAYGGVSGDQSGMISVIESALQRECSSKMQAPPGCSSCMIVIDDAHSMSDCASETLRGTIDGVHTINTATASSSSSKSSTKPGSSTNTNTSSNIKHGKLPNRVQVHPDYIGHAAQCDSYSDVAATCIIAATQYIDSTSRLWQQFVHLSLEEPDLHELTTVFNTALLQTFVGDRRSAYMHSSSARDGNSTKATLVYNSDVMSAITRVGRMAIKILQLLSDSEKTDGHTNNKYINYPTLLRLVKPFELANPNRITTVTSVLRILCHEILREVVEPYTSISTSEGTNCNTNAVTSAVKCMLSVIQQEASTIGIDTDQINRLGVTLYDACKQSDSTSSRVPFLWTDINGLLALQVLDSISSKRSILKSALQTTATPDSSTSSSANNSVVAYTEVSSTSDEFGLTLDSNSGRFVVSNGVILNSKNLYGIKALTVWLEYAIRHHYTVIHWPLYTQVQSVNGSVTTAVKPIITQEDVCNVMKVVRQLALPNNNSVVVLDDSRGMRIEGGINCITSLATLLQGCTLYTIDGCISHVTLASKHSTTAAATTTSNLLLSTSSGSSSSNHKASDTLRQAITATVTQYNAAASRGIQVPNKTVVLVTNAAHLLTTHSSSILRALHVCDIRDLFTDDELYKVLNNSRTNQNSDDATVVASTTAEPATRYRIDIVYSTVVSILRQCMTVMYCMSEHDRDRLLMNSSCGTNNSYYAAAIVKGCTVMRLATWSSVSQRYFTASNEVLIVAPQPLNATTSSSMSHVHLTGQLVSYNTSTSTSGTAAAAAHNEHMLSAITDVTAVTVPQLYSSWMQLVSNDVIQAVLTTVSGACTEAYSTLHLEHLQPLRSSELLVRTIDMYKHLCMIGATRLATRSAVLRKALANIDDWCIKGKGLTKQAQHIKILRAQYDKSIAELKDESAIVEAKKEAIVVNFTKQKADIDEVRGKLVQRQARVADILSPVTKLYENAATCIQQIRDDHLEALCGMSYGAQGDSGSDMQHHDDNGNTATAATSTTAATDSGEHTTATVVTQTATSHLSGTTVHKPQQDSNTAAKAAAAHTEMLLILESLAILMGYRTAYSDAIVQTTTTASADTATDNAGSSSNNNSNNSVSLVMRTFLMDPALTAKIEMFDTTDDRNKPALQVVMSMFEQRGSSSCSSSSSSNNKSPLLSAQPPSTASSGRKSMRTGRTSVLQQIKQSPAIVYARSLATRCSELINRSTALGVLTQFLSAVVVLYETQSECAVKTAAIDIEMKAVTDNEATVTRSYRESTASVVALQESIAVRKQEVALKLGDVRGRMPLLLDIQGMESGLNDAIGMCRKELSDLEQIAITWPGDCISFSAAICAGISALPYSYRQTILHAARTTAVRLGCPVSIANTPAATAATATGTGDSSTAVSATAAQYNTNSCHYDIDTADNNADNDDYADDVYNEQRNNDSFDNHSADDDASNDDDGEFPSITTYRYSDFCMGSMTCIEQIQSWVTANIHDKPVTVTTASTVLDADSTSNSNAEVHDVSVLAAGVSSLF
eukprot:16742-Heterococcus_DN1.PRE.1